ncbi:hypothetical protein [Hahella ganghwensis]|uniref:hypothetical protein n=1 Tax=Hahella ganghwensis TaxID=286420 RepID=UPI000369CFB1|nr:hypothetical protein [Hahella ganghwensis]
MTQTIIRILVVLYLLVPGTVYGSDNPATPEILSYKAEEKIAILKLIDANLYKTLTAIGVAGGIQNQAEVYKRLSFVLSGLSSLSYRAGFIELSKCYGSMATQYNSQAISQNTGSCRDKAYAKYQDEISAALSRPGHELILLNELANDWLSEEFQTNPHSVLF